ncbi:hypothetical protein H4R34_000931 [Dimargaris verticillata]|uniref:Hyaluronan/mRNA-binding protein domain-containing protein n=1 Tax=Dimargaris verticillata TaxID=2761393 RepID=A0A9W8EE93_9FUNG|nr:hypothetical protein H4R34_000931 [Dimargaris verticillata]
MTRTEKALDHASPRVRNFDRHMPRHGPRDIRNLPKKDGAGAYNWGRAGEDNVESLRQDIYQGQQPAKKGVGYPPVGGQSTEGDMSFGPEETNKLEKTMAAASTSPTHQLDKVRVVSPEEFQKMQAAAKQ